MKLLLLTTTLVSIACVAISEPFERKQTKINTWQPTQQQTRRSGRATLNSGALIRRSIANLPLDNRRSYLPPTPESASYFPANSQQNLPAGTKSTLLPPVPYKGDIVKLIPILIYRFGPERAAKMMPALKQVISSSQSGVQSAIPVPVQQTDVISNIQNLLSLDDSITSSSIPNTQQTGQLNSILPISIIDDSLESVESDFPSIESDFSSVESDLPSIESGISSVESHESLLLSSLAGHSQNQSPITSNQIGLTNGLVNNDIDIGSFSPSGNSFESIETDLSSAELINLALSQQVDLRQNAVNAPLNNGGGVLSSNAVPSAPVFGNSLQEVDLGQTQVTSQDAINAIINNGVGIPVANTRTYLPPVHSAQITQTQSNIGHSNIAPSVPVGNPSPSVAQPQTNFGSFNTGSQFSLGSFDSLESIETDLSLENINAAFGNAARELHSGQISSQAAGAQTGVSAPTSNAGNFVSGAIASAPITQTQSNLGVINSGSPVSVGSFLSNLNNFESIENDLSLENTIGAFNNVATSGNPTSFVSQSQSNVGVFAAQGGQISSQAAVNTGVAAPTPNAGNFVSGGIASAPVTQTQSNLGVINSASPVSAGSFLSNGNSFQSIELDFSSENINLPLSQQVDLRQSLQNAVNTPLNNAGGVLSSNAAPSAPVGRPLSPEPLAPLSPGPLAPLSPVSAQSNIGSSSAASSVSNGNSLMRVLEAQSNMGIVFNSLPTAPVGRPLPEIAPAPIVSNISPTAGRFLVVQESGEILNNLLQRQHNFGKSTTGGISNNGASTAINNNVASTGINNNVASTGINNNGIVWSLTKQRVQPNHHVTTRITTSISSPQQPQLIIRDFRPSQQISGFLPSQQSTISAFGGRPTISSPQTQFSSGQPRVTFVNFGGNVAPQAGTFAAANGRGGGVPTNAGATRNRFFVGAASAESLELASLERPSLERDSIEVRSGTLQKRHGFPRSRFARRIYL